MFQKFLHSNLIQRASNLKLMPMRFYSEKRFLKNTCTHNVLPSKFFHPNLSKYWFAKGINFKSFKSFCQFKYHKSENFQQTTGSDKLHTEGQEHENIFSFTQKEVEEGINRAQEYLNTGINLSIEGKIEEAMQEVNKALDMQINFLGPLSPVVGKTYMELGMIYQADKNTREALQCYEKSLEIFENSEENINNEDIAVLYEFIGDIYAEEDKLEEALAFYEESIETKTQLANNTQTEKDKKNLGNLFEKIGDYYLHINKFGEAKQNYLEALRVYKDILNNGNNEVIDMYKQAGYCACYEGNFDESLGYYNQALEVYKSTQETQGEDFEVVDTYEAIADTLFKKGDLAGTIDYDNRILRFYLESKFVGRTKAVYERLAKAYIAQGNEEKAMQIYKDGLQEHLRYYGIDHPAVEEFPAILKEFYIRQGRPQENENIEALIEKYKGK